MRFGVGMNTDHIDHEGFTSIPKALKKINSQYITAHFGKWGMGSNPSVFGYDVSDGPTKNKDGNFDNNRSQWEHVFKKDPKNIFSLTDRAIEFIDSSKAEEKPFYLQISHYAVHTNIELHLQHLANHIYHQKYMVLELNPLVLVSLAKQVLPIHRMLNVDYFPNLSNYVMILLQNNLYKLKIYHQV